jgi:hypothetical protein
LFPPSDVSGVANDARSCRHAPGLKVLCLLPTFDEKGKISFSKQIFICRGCVALQWERVGDGFVVKKRGWNIAYKVKEIQIRKHFAKNIK